MRYSMMIVLLFLLLNVACTVGVETTVPLPTMAVIVTPEPTATLQPGTTGIPEVDTTITAVLSNDLALRETLIAYTTLGCTTADGLGGPPKCTESQTDGTPVSFFPILGPGEGSPVLPEAIAQSIEFTTTAVYAVYRVSPQFDNDPAYPAGVYGVIFSVSHPGFSFMNVRLNEQGQIIRLDYMTQTPQEVIEREATDILVAPTE